MAAAVLVLGAAPAAAHAELTGTEPAAGARLDAAPERVVLRFTERVELPDDVVELYAASGDRLDVGEAGRVDGDDSAVAVDLPALDDGGYVVAWRVVSSDSHPISGAFTFQVGATGGADAEALRAELLAGGGGDRTLGVVYGAVRFAAFAGLVVLVGGAGFLLALWPAGLADPTARRLLTAGWAVAAVTTAASIGLQGAYGAGLGLADALDPGVIGDELGERAGRVWAVRLLLLAAAAVAGPLVARGVRGADRRRPLDEVLYGAALLGVGLLATISLTGHATSGDVVPLAVATDVVHLAAVSAWLGGLAVLVTAVLRPGVAPEAPPAAGGVDGAERVVGRFSALAFVAVVTIVVTGVVQAWRQLGSVGALVDTTYGRLLLVKVALVAAMLGAAGASRAWVRRHRAGPPGGGVAAAGDAASPAAERVLSPGPGAMAASSGPHRLRALRLSVAAEVAVAIAVLAVTAALVNAEPGTTAGDDPGGGATTLEMHGSAVMVEATVDPTVAGPTDIDVRTNSHGGTPLEPAEVTASLTLPERDLGPLDVPLERTGVGRYEARAVEVPFPGEWELEVVVRTTDIDQDRLAATFTVI